MGHLHRQRTGILQRDRTYQAASPATQMLQMFWAIGSIIVGAVTYVYNPIQSERAYKYVQIRIAIIVSR